MIIDESVIENMNKSRRRRRCSFCRCAGHTIKSCNDERITCFEELCQLKKWEYASTYVTGRCFSIWLATFAHEYSTSLSVIKAFAVRKCNALTRSYLLEHIEKIRYYFYGDLSHESLYNESLYNKYKINMMYDHNPEVVADISECSICYDPKIINDLVTLNCNHMFCGTCVVGIIKNNNKVIAPSCALCRENITSFKYSDTKFEHEMLEYVDM